MKREKNTSFRFSTVHFEPSSSTTTTPPTPVPPTLHQPPFLLMFRTFTRLTVPVVAFGAGFALFPSLWRKGNWQPSKLTHINKSVLETIEASSLYQKLDKDDSTIKYYTSEMFPEQHHKNHVGTGLLFGPNLFEIDPVLFINESKGELTGFYHLGKELISQDGLIHNGVTSTILDEGLCACGFAKLPSKKGVTANLTINFHNQAPPDSTVVLHAKVVEHRGRKVVIEGTLSTFTVDGTNATEIATSRCVLVEPQWFRYLRWLNL